VGVIVQDFYGSAASQSGVSGGARIGAAVTKLESRLLRAMDLVGVIDTGFVSTARDLGVREERIRTLPNWTHIHPPRLSRQQAREKFGWDDGLVRVVHTGNMGHKQGLENVVEAARRAVRSAPNHRFVLVGEGNQRRHLQELAAGLPTLEFMPAVDHQDYPDLLHAADVLLVNERPGATEMSLPSKVTSYLATDRPLLAAIPDGITRSYLRRLGVATIIEPGDPDALVAAAVGLSGGAGPVTRRGTGVPASLDSSLAGDRYERFCRELLDQKHSVVPTRGVR
jgi:glycosyltransferase involved in cell wall biosynthesis